MKKLISILITLILIVSLVGCNDNGNSSNKEKIEDNELLTNACKSVL